ncbi:hypothetical protein [Mycobacterium intracellulare]|uniref:Uncharacterized protein n=1 Tax=Mycobacterium intracellulare TaxID=1767 RepID=A0AAE4RG43_MYCIT|nr:hypothetical protein [Mycobacterium intracellulare]MDV6979610.1 hypothetical protein [Mycobacterium intracellulare]MDV6985113.1 hypothetical protein [Mycobacterium intracellulare]MDV7014267.1 hypothetical protein [Mycobacterium intracellulare]MDV7030103.1 hypothetical protein [Mycobacterium intracellulare]
MLGAINSLRILASEAFGAAAIALDPFKPADDELGRPYAAGYQAGAANERAGVHLNGHAQVGAVELLEVLTNDDEDDVAAGPSSAVTYLDEIAHHLAAQTPLLEDIRNLLNASAAPGAFASPAAAAEEGPAPGRTDCLPPGAGHLTATPQCLRVAARGLRQWVDGDVCTATSYWRSIAASLDAVAGAREAINDITQ